jgi:nucleotide-binding universal stress UspA family protein
MRISSDLKPKKPSRLLVAVDGSDTSMNAADYAIALAKNNNNNDNNEAAEIFVINVIDLPPIFKMLPSDTRKELISIGRQEANQMLDTVAEMAKRQGIEKKKIKTEIVETPASAADTIIKYGQEKDVDLIVVGTKGRSGMSKALLGSVASKVVTYSTCSVLVVR